MAINFAAEHMQGYNNPKVEIINVTVDGEGNITDITYNDIVKILSRGVFPIVAFRLTPAIAYFLPLEAFDEGAITFTCTHIYDIGTETPATGIYGIVFAPSKPPVFLQKAPD